MLSIMNEIDPCLSLPLCVLYGIQNQIFLHLSPPTSCYQRTSWSHAFSSFLDPTIRPIASTKSHRLLLANPQSFPNSKTLSTLWKCVGYVWVQIFSQSMTMRERKRRGYNDFSLRMSSSLSKRWVCMCVVENLSRFFSLNCLSYFCG